MKPRIFIRADGNSEIGMGHIVRCLSLTEMLTPDFDVVFLSRNGSEVLQKPLKGIGAELIVIPDSISLDSEIDLFKERILSNDIVVLDGYDFKSEYQKKVKSLGCKLAVIDDLHSWHQYGDLVINYADGIRKEDYKAEIYTKFCLGSEYILLRSEFLKGVSRKSAPADVKKILLSMGAADPLKLTRKFLIELMEIDLLKEIHVLYGSVNPEGESIRKLASESSRVVLHSDIDALELKSVMLEMDVCFCQASTIALESCSVGLPVIAGYTADNQMGILSGLTAKGAAINTGDLQSFTASALKQLITDLNTHPEKLLSIQKAQLSFIDGKSPDRIRKAFLSLIVPSLSFRFAEMKDADLYFKWTNDPLVRKNSYRQEPVTYENHIRWFEQKLKSDDCSFYLFYSGELPAGQVRIEKGKDETIIGISVDENFRGKSVGAEMIRIACADYFKKHGEAVIFAYIKEENRPSLRIFTKAGFGSAVKVNVDGADSFKLSLKSSAHE